jgi:uncharacterized membrane protein
VDELLPILLVVLLSLGFVICTIVLPIIALVRTRRIRQFNERLNRIERELRDRATLPAVTTPLSPGAATQQQSPLGEVEAARVAELAARLDRLETQLRQTESLRPSEPAPVPSELSRISRAVDLALWPVRPARPASEQPAAIRPAVPVWTGPDAATLEAWIGRRGLGWVAVVLLLFATAFFLKYAFENRWIGELGRVAIGVLAGLALCLGGYRYHRRGWRIFSQMLSAGGVVLLYLATFAAFGYYHLIPQAPAAGYLIALVVETAALAALYEAPAIALMAVIGGLLVPILLHTDRDQYRSLFTYLVILNAGMAGLALFRRWRAVGSVALIGSQILFWLWYTEHYHPEKRAAALGFQAALFAIYLAYGVLAHVVRRRPADAEDLVRLVVNACLFTLAGYGMLDEDYHVWMGSAALGLAAVYAALGWLVLRLRPEDQRQLLVVIAVSMGFVAAAIPLQAEAAWIPVGWAVQGLVLWAFAYRIRAAMLRYLGGVLLILAVGRLIFVDTPYLGREPFVPFFNKYGLPATLVAGCLLAAAGIGRRLLGRLDCADRACVLITGLGGIALLWLILSVETVTYFTARMPRGGDASLERSAQTTLSVAWAVYAALVLWAGFRLRSLPLRWAALAIFASTLAKVLLVDMAGLPGLYRVLALFVLALMMGGAAWAYQKYQHLQLGGEQEDAP